MTPLDLKHQRLLYWWAMLLHFSLFSVNALASVIIAALVGAEWSALSGQQKFLICVAVIANWTGLILVFVQRGMGRIVAGKPPLETGDTERLAKGSA